jgi:hypothetical protein
MATYYADYTAYMGGMVQERQRKVQLAVNFQAQFCPAADEGALGRADGLIDRPGGHSPLAPAQQTQNKLEESKVKSQLSRKTKVLVMKMNYVCEHFCGSYLSYGEIMCWPKK